MRSAPEHLVLACVLALHVGLAALIFDPTPSIGGDDARYMVLAEALESGRGYRDIHRPGEPPHELYPPLFPALLALVRHAGGEIVAYKTLCVGFSTASVFFAFALARRRLGPAGGLAFAAAWALNPVLLSASHEVQTEVPFAMLVLASLAAAEASPDRRRAPALAVVVALLAYATRSAGLALLAALPLAWLLERRFRSALGAAAAGASFVAIASWTAWGTFAPRSGDSSYLDLLLLVDPYAPELGRLGFAGVVARAGRNLVSYASESLPEALAGSAVPAALALALSICVLVLALLAALRTRRPRAMECFAACYAAMLLLWSGSWIGARYLLPLLPCLLLLALQAVGWLAGRRRHLVPAAGVLLALLALPDDVRLAQRSLLCRAVRAEHGQLSCYAPAYRAYNELAVWAGAHLPRDAVVVSRKPHTFHYFSGLHSEVYPFTPDASRVQAFFDEIGASHVLVDSMSSTTARYLNPAIRRMPGRFEIVKRIEHGGRAATLLAIPSDARSSR